MNNLDKYMNDPEIVNEPMPLREVHAIRLMISDETKDMTPEQVKAYYQKGIDEAHRKYKFKKMPNKKTG